MSRVLLIAADKHLSLCDRQTERTKVSIIGGETFSVTCPAGFRVTEHTYYRSAVDALGFSMKPFQYELELETCEEDLAHLMTYLREHFTSGEEVELWNLWVGGDDLGRAPHYRGKLSAFDMETLRQFLEPAHPDGSIGQCRMTVII